VVLVALVVLTLVLGVVVVVRLLPPGRFAGRG
jgi:hypothetical protein